MSFATEQEKQNSDRWVLVRITPAHHVSNDLSSAGSGVYTMSFSLPIARVERNGAALEETASDPPSSNDTWYHDEATSSFKVKLAGAPSETTNLIVIHYYLFYASQSLPPVCEDPTDSSTPLRLWEPRLVNPPQIRQSVKNLLAGVFTIEASSVSISNGDDAFQAFLTAEDSFNDVPVECWICINDAANIQKVFTGRVRALSVGDVVSIQVFDTFSRLSQPAYMGDTVDEASFRKTSTSFPDMDPRDNDKPCPLILGSQSRARLIKYDFTVAAGQHALWTDHRSENRAVCVDYSETGATTVNRTWGCCRVPSDGLLTQSFGSITRVKGVGPYWRVQFSSHNLRPGMQVKWAESGTDYYGLVLYSDPYTEIGTGDAYNCVIAQVYPERGFLSPDLTASSTFTALKGFALWHRQPSDTGALTDAYNGRPLFQTLDFTLSETATSGGNKYVEVEFVSDFESSFGTREFSSAPNPLLSTDEVMYLVWLHADTELSHAETLERIAVAAGLAVDSVSFAAADVGFASDCLFQIPMHGEARYGRYLEYAQKILESTAGVLFANASGVAEYHLLAEPSATIDRDENETIKATVGGSVEYTDIVTQIVAQNDHDWDPATASVTGEESKRARYLYGVVNPLVMEHVLADISDRMAVHLGLRSRPTIIYTFATATKDLSTDINDDVTLESTRVLGGSGSADIKVLSVEKGIENAVVQAAVIEGLP